MFGLSLSMAAPNFTTISGSGMVTLAAIGMEIPLWFALPTIATRLVIAFLPPETLSLLRGSGVLERT